MKKLTLTFLVIVGASILFSCKKDVAPELIVTVVDEQNVPKGGLFITVTVDGSDLSRVDSAVVLRTQNTDEFGKVYFDFENTILVDVSLYAFAGSGVKLDSTSVLLETERSTDDDNVIQRKLVDRR